MNSFTYYYEKDKIRKDRIRIDWIFKNTKYKWDIIDYDNIVSTFFV